MVVVVRPYICQDYSSIRRSRPAGDHQAGLIPVDSQDVWSLIMGLYKWLLRICGTRNPL